MNHLMKHLIPRCNLGFSICETVENKFGKKFRDFTPDNLDGLLFGFKKIVESHRGFFILYLSEEDNIFCFNSNLFRQSWKMTFSISKFNLSIKEWLKIFCHELGHYLQYKDVGFKVILTMDAESVKEIEYEASRLGYLIYKEYFSHIYPGFHHRSFSSYNKKSSKALFSIMANQYKEWYERNKDLPETYIIRD